jgi:hypothetical protein
MKLYIFSKPCPAMAARKPPSQNRHYDSWDTHTQTNPDRDFIRVGSRTRWTRSRIGHRGIWICRRACESRQLKIYKVLI